MRTILWSVGLGVAVGLVAGCGGPAKSLDGGAGGAGGAFDEDGDGYAAGEDCNDEDASAFPGALERCDGVDNNCDGAVDEGVLDTVFPDADGDGFGDGSRPETACGPGGAYVSNGNDCDDARADVWPGNPEACDGLDNDCNGAVDDGVGETVWTDADGDGYGDPGAPAVACGPGPGTADNALDCDDGDAGVRPGAAELCNGVDDDCDGVADDGLLERYYADVDGDSFGDDAAAVDACARPDGAATRGGDCDDFDFSVFPGAPEACDDPVDRNCDGAVAYADGDGDGWAACTECDDRDAAVNPAAAEVCNAGVDDDCDGLADDADPSLDRGTGAPWYADTDGDTHGDPGSVAWACTAPAGHVATDLDCDDGAAAISPDATEVCNDLDDDCDGAVDVGAVDATAWAADADGDGYGDPGSVAWACDRPAGHGLDTRDCDDTDAAERPGAVERLDGDDDDCDGIVDEAAVALVFAEACTSAAGHPSLTPAQVAAAEEAVIEAHLNALLLGMDRHDEPAAGWAAAGVDLSAYDLVVFTDCGWSWVPAQQGLVDALLAARGLGTATLMLGDDLAWMAGNVSGEEALTFLRAAGSNGTNNLSVALTGATHPALAGPGGTPSAFVYPYDIDAAGDWGGGEVVLARASNGTAAWSVYEDAATGARGAMLPMSVGMANHGTLGATAEAQVGAMFRSSAWWALGL
jgi:hypothetical protein